MDDKTLVERVMQRGDELVEKLTPELNIRIALSYRKHIIGFPHPNNERDYKNDETSFWEEFFSYSPVEFSEEENEFLFKCAKEWPGSGATHFICHIAYHPERGLNPTKYFSGRHRGDDPIMDVVGDIHLIYRGSRPSEPDLESLLKFDRKKLRELIQEQLHKLSDEEFKDLAGDMLEWGAMVYGNTDFRGRNLADALVEHIIARSIDSGKNPEDIIKDSFKAGLFSSLLFPHYASAPDGRTGMIRPEYLPRGE